MHKLAERSGEMDLSITWKLDYIPPQPLVITVLASLPMQLAGMLPRIVMSFKLVELGKSARLEEDLDS